jgi:hypothetical protein
MDQFAILIATERDQRMALKSILLALFLLLNSEALSAQPVRHDQPLPEFMGQAVTVVQPKLDADGFFPAGPASVCVEFVPQKQCYTAPKDFGRDPKVTVVQLKKGVPALFFRAAGGGVSGFPIHFALLRPGETKNLEDSLDISVSDQSQHAFWNEPAISTAPIFVTADYVWGPEEGHHVAHRYIISTYVFGLSREVDRYYLQDQYMTVQKYDLDAKTDILASEKQQILVRLRRVKAETERRKGSPR